MLKRISPTPRKSIVMGQGMGHDFTGLGRWVTIRNTSKRASTPAMMRIIWEASNIFHLLIGIPHFNFYGYSRAQLADCQYLSKCNKTSESYVVNPRQWYVDISPHYGCDDCVPQKEQKTIEQAQPPRVEIAESKCQQL